MCKQVPIKVSMGQNIHNVASVFSLQTRNQFAHKNTVKI